MAEFWTDPYRQRQLELAADEQIRRHNALRNLVTEQRSQQLAEMLRTYPTMSPELAQGVFAANAEQTGSTMAALAMREERVRMEDEEGGGPLGWLKRNIVDPVIGGRNWVFDRIKSGVRGLFTFGEGAWEELLARPLRTLVGAISQGRTDFRDLWGEAGSSDLLYAIRELRAGREVNLGSGFLPGSDDPKESEAYRQAIEEGMSEEDALGIAEEQIGAPITDIGRQQRQTGITFRGQPISFGRMIAGSFLEPGTKPYHLLSGLVDAAARLTLDPTARTLRGLSFAKKGAAMFSGTEAAAGESLRALTARNFAAGLVPGIRKTVRGQSVDSWLMSKDGTRVCEAIANTTGADAFSIIKDVLQRNNPTSVSRGLILHLAEETDAGKVAQLLRPHLGLNVISKPGQTTVWKALGLPSMTRGLGGALGGEWGGVSGFGVTVKHLLSDTRLGRLFEKMPGRSVAIDDLDDGLNQLDDFMKAAHMGAARRSEFMAQWARLKPGDSAGALKVMKGVMKSVEDDLVATAKIPRELARHATFMFDDIQTMRSYFVDKIGQPGWFPGAETGMIAGEKVTMPTAQLITEYLHRAIPLPDPVALRRAFSKADKLHRYVIGARRGAYRTLRHPGTKLGDEFRTAIREATHGDEAIERGAMEAVLDFYMGKVWKPMVLLRLAWPVRVVGEEQLRMAGAGLASIFSHPMSYISWQIGRGKTGLLKASKMGDDYVELAMSRSHRQAMSVGSGGSIDDQGRLTVGKRVGARQGYANYARTGPRKPYVDAWTDQMMRLADDPVARRVADDAVAAKAAFWDGDLKNVRIQLARGSSKKWRVLNDRRGADNFIDAVRARIAETTGGTFEVTHRVSGKPFRPGIDSDFDALYVVQSGNKTLERAIATGDLGGVKLARVSKSADIQRLKRTLGSKYLYQGAAPDYVSGASWLDTSATNIYDRAVTTLFNGLMSSPTNKLSRSPAFRQYYWERIEGLAPFMSEKVLARTIRAANAAKMPKAMIARLEKITPASGKQALTAISDADDLAKAFALHSTKKLLYDLTTRHQWTQAMHNIFPFGEAWVEILTSWGRLIYRNPQILRRGQQIVEGARGSGIFYKDPVSGEEVFAYPGGGLLSKWMFGDDSPASLRLQGTVQGLNLAAGSYLPGFGPLVQFPASWVIPDTPAADGIRNLILPYGNARIGSPGDVIDAAMPAWMKKLVQAASSPSANTELARLQANTTVDVLRSMLLTGRWNLDTPEAAEAAIKSASRRSTFLTAIRGFAQLILPTGPQVAFQVKLEGEDHQGRAYFFQTLASEYWDKVRNTFDGDEDQAMRWFIASYGFNPYDIVTPKSQVVSRRSVTGAGDDWARQNSDLFDMAAFPHTAYYARPDQPEEEFDYQAYIRQLEQGSRVGYTPEQWAVARNQTLGRIRYQHYKDMLGGRTDIYARQYLSQMRAWLQTQYPGYGYPNVGTVERPDTPMLMEELGRWQSEPRLAGSEAGLGLAAYLRAVRWAEQASVAAGYSANGYQSADSLRGLRLALRSQAEWLMARYPDFAGLWLYVLRPQLEDDSVSLPSETADTLLDRLTGGSI